MINGRLREDPFSGDSLLELLVRPPPSPVMAGIPTLGSLTLLVAPAFNGKSSLAYWTALARAAGVAPWEGAPTPDREAVLFLSPDESAEQIVRRMDGLARQHPAGKLDSYAENLHVIAADPNFDDRVLAGLRLDDDGLARLGKRLESGFAGRPFAEVYLDAFADMLPHDESENDNGVATRIGGGLQSLAVRFGCAITLLHHAGKPAKDAPVDGTDVRFLGRGASALAAKARVVFSLEHVPEMPWARQIRTVTNLGATPKAVLFEVAPEGSEGELAYFKPIAPPQPKQFHPRDFLREGSEITTSGLAALLEEHSKTSGGRRFTGGDAKNLATRLRGEWQRLGLIEVTDGPRNAKLIRLRDDVQEPTHA